MAICWRSPSWDLALHPDGGSVIVAPADGTVREWPLEPAAGDASRVLFRAPQGYVGTLAVDPRGRWLLAGTQAPGGPWLIPLDGSPARSLPGLHCAVWTVTLSPDGRFAAAAGDYHDESERVIRIWDLDTGEEVRVLDLPGLSDPGTS